MSLIFDEMPTGGKKRVKDPLDRLPDGQVHARIVSIIGYGLQPQTDWQTKEATDPKDIVAITFETPSEMITYKDKEGNEVTKPRWISKEYMVSNSEMSNMYKLRKALKPDAKSLDEFVNMPVMINIGSTEPAKNAKVVGVSKPMSGFDVPELLGDAFYFDFDHPNMELFKGLHAWQQKKVKEALNYNGFADGGAPAKEPKPTSNDFDDDIPF